MKDPGKFKTPFGLWPINFTLVFLLLSPALVSSEPRADADFVCTRTTTKRTDRLVNKPKEIEIKYQSLCGLLPCTKTRYETQIDSHLEPVYEEIQVSACCPGYAETPDARCAPICINSCNNGKCIKPGLCQCQPEPTENSPGYTGSYCNRFTCLSANRWGFKCEHLCDCPHANSYCSAHTGKCLCRAGWRGANCTEECEPSMNCVDVDLPPIVEPEVNLILDSTDRDFQASQRLRLAEASALGRHAELDDSLPSSRSVASLVATHMGLNLLLTILTFSLFFAVFWYRRRLNKLRNEIYYSSPYNSSSGPSRPGENNSIYSDPSFAGTIHSNRPRMPLPDEGNFLGKNLDFATATRQVLTKAGSLEATTRARFIVDPKMESHLVASQRGSEQNIYSEPIVNALENIYSEVDTIRSEGSHKSFQNPLMPSIAESSAEDHLYQVPRAQAQPVGSQENKEGEAKDETPMNFYKREEF